MTTGFAHTSEHRSAFRRRLEEGDKHFRVPAKVRKPNLAPWWVVDTRLKEQRWILQRSVRDAAR